MLVNGAPYYPNIQKRNGTLGSPCAQVAASSAAAMREDVFGTKYMPDSEALLIFAPQSSAHSLSKVSI